MSDWPIGLYPCLIAEVVTNGEPGLSRLTVGIRYIGAISPFCISRSACLIPSRSPRQLFTSFATCPHESPRPRPPGALPQLLGQLPSQHGAGEQGSWPGRATQTGLVRPVMPRSMPTELWATTRPQSRQSHRQQLDQCLRNDHEQKLDQSPRNYLVQRPQKDHEQKADQCVRRHLHPQQTCTSRLQRQLRKWPGPCCWSPGRAAC